MRLSGLGFYRTRFARERTGIAATGRRLHAPRRHRQGRSLRVEPLEERALLALAPTDILLDNASIPENQPAGTVVGELSTVDDDVLDTFTYDLVSGEGGDDNSLFLMDGSTLKANSAFDFEAKSSYSIRVASTDEAGLTFEKPFVRRCRDRRERALHAEGYQPGRADCCQEFCLLLGSRHQSSLDPYSMAIT